MTLPPEAIETLTELRKFSNRKLKRERRDVEELMFKMPNKNDYTHKSCNNLLILIKMVQKERSDKKKKK